MDGKLSFDEPPPYTALPTNHPISNEFQLNSLTYHLQHHVSSLPDRIRATQQVRKAEQTSGDASLLDHIVPIVEEFLADLGARHTPVPLATLTLIPDVAVPKNAMLSGLEDMKRRGEICRVSRISMDKISKDSKSNSETPKSQNVSEDPSWASGQEFTGWGRFGEPESPSDDTERNKLLWWRDEEMARRLATYLQPRKEKTAPKTVVQAVVEQRIPAKKEKKSWLWGKRASGQTSESAPTPTETEVKVDKTREEEKGAEMVVTAQEVAFRQENELGIWESFPGWGVVVAVKVKT
ncbi:uncharacterized protein GGS22DRAFT_46713 [Annulohypoxylon maeteangense]|uniref:uncharacterized protein n=1 Tax=Annulohypoxylon maeteangense TaxID=1927788 RepID=UPI0020087788|nr:uncharacterized protein GGS22DRAFT_46713 [Annulohypoxylon maeteangense]KAI0882597.1 hypothetical protein GGS22DRAFT_46713 [Annulohypoxylon maeteangense]